MAYSPIAQYSAARLLRLLRRVGMFWPEDLLPDPERFLEERFGFGVLAHCPVQLGQIIEARRRVGMFWPKNLLPDPERFLKSGSALAYSPIAWYSTARLLRLLPCRDVLAQELSAESAALPGRAVRLWRSRP